jgi:crotonobetainyl-CoA:carnitine CoA-transferase CaiB-like acyl-CoA transferase
MYSADKPLKGYTVLDLTWVYSGPYCTSLLYDLGADVIKIEAPKYGDHTRNFPPFRNGSSGYCYSFNRGKRSIALNLKNDEGKDIFKEMVKKVDIVVENYVPGVMEKMGLGYDVLKEINPGIIYGCISGFGSWGPYSNLPGVDPIAQAMGGLMSLSGFPGGPPLKTGPAVADAIAGIYLALGITSALLEKAKTGVGKRVEVGMMDAVFSVLEESVVRTSMTGDSLPARGNTDPLGAPWDAFETADGKWLMICSLGGDRFDKLYRLIGRDDIADAYVGDGEEVSTRRSNDLGMLNSVFAEWVRKQTADYVIKTLRELKVPCGVVKTIPELLEDPHLLARNMVVEIDHPRLGKIKTFNAPIMFGQQSIGIAPGENPLEPELGEHNAEVLEQILGFDSDKVRSLYDSGALWTGSKD